MLFDNNIYNLINFNRKMIFEDANVETSIFILNKDLDNDNCLVGQDLDNKFFYDKNEWRNNLNYIITFAENEHINRIIQKLNKSEYKLSDILDVSNGFKPYQVGYGKNLENLPLNKLDVENKIYHSSQKLNDNYKKEIKGKGVKRYNLIWEENYINFGPWLMSPKDSRYFESNKILLRQVISDYLFSYVDSEKYYADQTLYVITNYENRNENLHYYSALLNSRLYGFYFRKFYSEEDDLFPKIKVNELKNLPFKHTTSEYQKPLIEMAEKMLALNKDLQNTSTKFSKLLASELGLTEPSKKLQEWYNLEFTDFAKELKKKKIELSLAQKAEWMDFFETEKQKVNQIQAEIQTTDKQIDQMVYDLYELTLEEIEIVEKA